MLTVKEIQNFKKEIKYNQKFPLQAALAKCLADPSCLKILYVLTKGKNVCPSDLSEILGLSLPAISHQLARLKQMGIVQTIRHKQMICYSLADLKESRLIRRLVMTIVK